MSGVRTIPVASDDSNIRLDRWFRRNFPDVAHGRLEKLLRTGQVRVDGARAKASTRLSAGQEIRVPPLGASTRSPKQPPKPVSPEQAATLRDLVLYRDDDVIAINKPPGLAVQGGSRVRHHLDGMLDALRFGAAERPRLVHRLDKDTSGVLLLGRTARATAHLAEIFRGKNAVKTYWALTVGVPHPEKGLIDLAVAKRAAGPGAREKMMPDAEAGKRAVTYYAVVETASSRAAWLALRPLTGRTHQLRVHCAAMGTPILGDGKYGGPDAFITGVPGGASLMLHARDIEMPHPSGDRLRVVAPLPDSMTETWKFLGFDPDTDGDPFVGLEI